MEEAKFREALLRRLDVLIALELERPGDEKAPTMASRVKRLSSYGLSASEIASIVRKPVNYITATLSSKSRKRSGGNGGGA